MIQPKWMIVPFLMGMGLSCFSQASCPDENRVRKLVSDSYYKYWSLRVQEQIDRDIETYRKADAVVNLENLKPQTEVKVEQISHEFLFGANIFLFGDLGSDENNGRYERTFGDLFNGATVPFYWKTLEPEQGKVRYEAGSSYEYRRPATDPVVEFCERKGIAMNGHAVIYGMRRWAHPVWMPEEREAMEPLFEAHIKELALRYKDRIQRWDVVNESVDQANRGMMPTDYMFKTYRWANQYFPPSVQFNTNDINMPSGIGGVTNRYVEIVRDLIARGARVDNVGIQCHIYSPAEAQSIANGADYLTPQKVYAILDLMRETGRPIHISEVTVSASADTEEGRIIQSEITKNLYRLWFSYPDVMGISWWNVVDGGAAPGETSISGVYDTNMKKKPVYHTLDQLINHEWKTDLTLKAGAENRIDFRGFKGRYRITWRDNTGKQQTKEITVSNKKH